MPDQLHFQEGHRLMRDNRCRELLLVQDLWRRFFLHNQTPKYCEVKQNQTCQGVSKPQPPQHREAQRALQNDHQKDICDYCAHRVCRGALILA